MRRKQARIDPAEAHAARLAWWAAFVTTVVLVLALMLVHTAEAATASPVGPAPSLATPLEFELEEEDEEEDEWEAEECEAGEFEESDAEGEGEGEFEFEECDGEEEEEDSPPPQCRLESADAAVSADLVHRRVHLALRYTAARSTPVGIKYFLRGRRGPLALRAERPRLSRQGVFRVSQNLTPAQVKKVAAAKSFTIQVRPGGAPGFCREYLDQSLTVRRGGQGGPMWIDTESTFRHARHA
jgi:hypothetical protein